MEEPSTAALPRHPAPSTRWLLGEGHEAVIHEREGMWWVAEFRFGAATLRDASTWLRFHSGALRFSPGHRAQALASAGPMPPQLQREIERLHLRESAEDERLTKVCGVVVRLLRRCGLGTPAPAGDDDRRQAHGQRPGVTS
ncbi:MAG: hypothetical protein M3Z16_03565 [Pseudomonadota bacterium]|nr:hypothetical protein [Pseudomonadota bacterium]